MNRPSSECNQACLNCWVAREIGYKPIDHNVKDVVVDRGIEPLCQDWESCILTIRWIDQQHVKDQSRRSPLAEGGGFEPPVREPVRQFSKLLVSATHPSFQKDLRVPNLGASPRLRVQRYDYFLIPPNFYPTFFRKSYLNATTWVSVESR